MLVHAHMSSRHPSFLEVANSKPSLSFIVKLLLELQSLHISVHEKSLDDKGAYLIPPTSSIAEVLKMGFIATSACFCGPLAKRMLVKIWLSSKALELGWQVPDSLTIQRAYHKNKT